MPALFIIICIASLLFGFYPVSGQPQFRFEHITVVDGMPSNTTYHIMQDHMGFLWFSSQSGLVRYDGYEYKTYIPDSTDPNSISFSRVNQVLEDSRGDLWISSEFYGLNKFERKSGKFYRVNHKPHDQNSLSSDSIFKCFMDSYDLLWIVYTNRMLDILETRTGNIHRNPHLPASIPFSSKYGISLYRQFLNLISIEEDIQGNVWLGTDTGIFCYVRKMNQFTHYWHNPEIDSSLSCDTVTAIHADKKGLIWIATWGGGLNCFHPSSKTFSHFQHEKGNNNSISNDYILYLFEDNSGKIWITLKNGLDVLDTEKNTFKHFRNNPGDPGSLNRLTSLRYVYALPVYEDASGFVWFNIGGITTYTIAYDIYDPKLNKFYNLRANTDDPFDIRGMYSTGFFKDFSGNIWIGSIERGINKLNPKVMQFINYLHQANDENSISSNSVTAIAESKTEPGTIWIGTKNGLDKYNRKTGEFKHFVSRIDNPNSIITNTIYSLFEDSRKILWIGTNRGYRCYDIRKNKFENFYNDPNNPKVTSPIAIWSICEDNKGFIWLAEIYEGLYCCDATSRKIINYYKNIPGNKNSLSSNVTWCVYSDHENNLWVGTDNGMCKFDYGSGKFTNYLAGIDVYVIKEDSKGNLWLGTRKNGLGLFDRKTGKTSFYTTHDGLCNNRIQSLTEDKSGNIWLGTESGLSKFNIKTNSFLNFYEDDGLPTQMFEWNAATINCETIWMTTAHNGIIVFNPNQLGYNLVPPKIVINSMMLFNKRIFPGDHSPLKEDITVSKIIHLKHFQNDISLECTALHYNMPQKNQYSFWLENYDKEWYNAGYNRTATYTNLDPGTYYFHAKASNSDNVWNEDGVTLEIVIYPPWWRTWWAYLLYTLILTSLIWLFWKEQIRRVKLKHALEMKEFETNKLQEVDRLKSDFFTGISHEFRTPLTLILGPAEQMINEVKENKWKVALRLIVKNGHHLLDLINQLLDFSKIEAGRMKLLAKEEDIVQLLKGMVHSFTSLAEQKKINLAFTSDREKMDLYIDRDKLDKIISNLLSNAFKYTPEGGNIDVNFSVVKGPDGERAQIIVSDTGKGIAPQKLAYVFDRYYRADENDGNTGTGIGLALTKELVELHHGSIQAESQQGKGSSFIINLLLGRKHLKDEEIETEKVEVNSKLKVDHFDEINPEKMDQSAKRPENIPRILLVEDNDDVRSYIKGFLESDYFIEESINGKIGFEKAVGGIPDLIISDVMMPEMDGFTLCEKLKNDERTSHIPVILLTARASEASKLEGLETGADGYIIKPFSTKEVQIRVKKLIEQRRKLRERFSRDITLSPKEISITSADERFLTRAMEIIERHMNNSEFDVDEFSRQIGMSHSQLYRKVHALTNHSPVELIRSIRLKRAASLLKHKYGNISEIAYETGFSTPSYFTECFQKQFGKLPSEFAENK